MAWCRSREAITELVSSPQFRHQLALFSHALMTGQLDISQFGLRSQVGGVGVGVGGASGYCRPLWQLALSLGWQRGWQVEAYQQGHLYRKGAGPGRCCGHAFGLQVYGSKGGGALLPIEPLSAGGSALPAVGY